MWNSVVNFLTYLNSFGISCIAAVIVHLRLLPCRPSVTKRTIHSKAQQITAWHKLKKKKAQATTTNHYTPQNQKPTHHGEKIAFTQIPLQTEEVLPEGGKLELKLVQTGYAGGVNDLYTRQISVQVGMGRDKIVLLHRVLLSHVVE